MNLQSKITANFEKARLVSVEFEKVHCAATTANNLLVLYPQFQVEFLHTNICDVPNFPYTSKLMHQYLNNIGTSCTVISNGVHRAFLCEVRFKECNIVYLKCSFLASGRILIREFVIVGLFVGDISFFVALYSIY